MVDSDFLVGGSAGSKMGVVVYTIFSHKLQSLCDFMERLMEVSISVLSTGLLSIYCGFDYLIIKQLK